MLGTKSTGLTLDKFAPFHHGHQTYAEMTFLMMTVTGGAAKPYGMSPKLASGTSLTIAVFHSPI